jgi:GH24 family phage-related lysozyme (muramidase)
MSKTTLYQHPNGEWKDTPPSYIQRFTGVYIQRKRPIKVLLGIIFFSGVFAGQLSYDWAIADSEEGIMLITDQPGQEEAADIVSLPATAHEDIELPATQDSTYAYWLWYLKSREGYVYKEYKCPAGKTTVGYGHNIDAHGLKYCGKYLSGKTISYKAATELLVADAQRQYNWLMKQFPHLNRKQALAVTALLLNCGSAKVQYTRGDPKRGLSTFWKKLQRRETPNFLPYCKYKTPEGKVVTASNLQDARRFEQALFVGDDQTVKRKAQLYRRTIIKRDIGSAKKHDLLN